jgi:uncharacterized protein YndB with AHSA1/START domain
MITALIAAASLLIVTQQDTAEQPLVASAVVNAPVKEVWKAWTTSEGIRSWMVAAGEVDLRIGGALRTSYTKDSDLKGKDVIVNTILAFDPERMLTIRNTQSPEKFPFKKAMADCWTVIYLRPVDEAKTEVVVRMNGYNSTEESQKMKAFFKQGNQMTLDALVKRFEKK